MFESFCVFAMLCLCVAACYKCVAVIFEHVLVDIVGHHCLVIAVVRVCFNLLIVGRVQI